MYTEHTAYQLVVTLQRKIKRRKEAERGWGRQETGRRSTNHADRPSGKAPRAGPCLPKGARVRGPGGGGGGGKEEPKLSRELPPAPSVALVR